MPASPPHEPRFGFLDAMDHDEPSERPLADITRASIPGIARMAEDVIALLNVERAGIPKEQEARLQNRILRLSIQRRIDPGDIRSRILAQIRNTHGEEVAHLSSEALQNIEIGIHGTLAAIETLRAEFARTQMEHPNTRQLIATNDTLDASRKIDLIEVRYTPGAPVVIDEIRFIQSKARAAPSAAEQEAIIEAHREYHGEIMTIPEVEMLERRARSTKEMRTEVAELKMVFAHGTFNEQIDAVIQHRGEILDALLSHGTALDEKMIVEIARAHHAPIGWLKLFMEQTNVARTALVILADSNIHAPTTAVERALLMDRLSQWAVHHDVTAAELRELTPDWRLDPRYRPFVRCTSLTVVRGHVTASKQLDAPDDDPRALTVR